MSFVESLFTWGNAVYTFALATTLGFALVQMSGVLGWLSGAEGDDGDSNAEGGDAGEGDSDAGEADPDAADGDPHDNGVVRGSRSGMGGGRVPFSMIWQTFGTTFGLSGLALNTFVLAGSGGAQAGSLFWTMPMAALTSYLVTRLVRRGLGRLLADDAGHASSRRELVGRLGVVISSQLSTQFGEVRIRDKASHVRVICKLIDGPPVFEGTEVVIVDCDRGQLYAAALDSDAVSGRSASGRESGFGGP
jgi:membrane protein implicated in regulation of membrane protease activity